MEIGANHNHKEQEEEEEVPLDLSLDLLPKEEWSLSTYLYFYNNFWCPSNVIRNVASLRTRFRAQDSDILLATKPKSGTTWVKALAFSLLNRHTYSDLRPTPLLSSNPHSLVPFLEYPPPGAADPLLHLSQLSPPRLLSTHIPYSALPASIRTSSARIVYLCRNPFDTIVSFLKFKEAGGKAPDDRETEDCVDAFCRGVEGFGPHWDHVLGYWNASLEDPTKVLFVKYEDLKEDETSEIKRLAAFLGVPFTPEEERGGAVDGISELCSIRNLKELEVNKSGKSAHGVEYKSFFRKGEVGDWKNHISPALYDRLDKLMREKFEGTGLTFKASI